MCRLFFALFAILCEAVNQHYLIWSFTRENSEGFSPFQGDFSTTFCTEVKGEELLDQDHLV